MTVIQPSSMPKDFRLNNNKDVEYCLKSSVGTSHWTFVCSYLIVTNIIKDSKNGKWGKLINIEDRESIKHYIIPLSMLSRSDLLLGELLSIGVRINMDTCINNRIIFNINELLVQYINNYEPIDKEIYDYNNMPTYISQFKR
jgi:Domain of unknown function (DUF927)